MQFNLRFLLHTIKKVVVIIIIHNRTTNTKLNAWTCIHENCVYPALAEAIACKHIKTRKKMSNNYNKNLYIETGMTYVRLTIHTILGLVCACIRLNTAQQQEKKEKKKKQTDGLERPKEKQQEKRPSCCCCNTFDIVWFGQQQQKRSKKATTTWIKAKQSTNWLCGTFISACQSCGIRLTASIKSWCDLSVTFSHTTEFHLTTLLHNSLIF